MLEKFCWIVGIYIVVAIIEIIIVNWAMNKFFWIKYEKDSPISNSVHFRGSWKASVLTKQKGEEKSMEENKRNIIKCYDDILSSIEKLQPQSADVLLFFIKTDKYGQISCDLDDVRNLAKFIQEALDKTGKYVQAIFIPDTISLFSMADADYTIGYLQKAIDELNRLKHQVGQELDDVNLMPHQLDLTDIDV